VLLPPLGLLGAVAATAVATLLTLLGQLYVNHRTGMQLHRGTILVMFTPALLILGPTPAAIGAAAILALAIARGWLLTPHERQQITATALERLSRFTTRLGVTP
jgi:hypothetical protein